MMKAKELKNLSVEELNKKLDELIQPGHRACIPNSP